MRRLNFYLFRQLLIAFLFTATAVSCVVLFTQMFRLLSIVIDNAGTMMVFFRMLGLSVPTFLPLVLPLALGTATVFTYHKLAVDSELPVMSAAGISPMRLAKPALVLGVLVSAACLVLTLWVTPQANRSLVNLQYKGRNSYAVFLSRPGSFNDMAEGVTFYAHRRGAGGVLEGVLIHDVRNADMPVTIMASSGQVVVTNGQPQMIVFNGRRQEMDVQTGKLSELAFDQYVLELNALHSTSSRRLADPREQTIHDLLHPTDEMLTHRASYGHLMTELHQRLAAPWLALAYMLIGLAAILVGEFNRRGAGRRILIAAFSIVVVQASFMSLSGVTAQHRGLVVLLYLTTLLPILIGLYLLRSASAARGPA